MAERIRSPFIIAVLLAVMVAALYSNTLDNSAVNWDDPVLFTKKMYYGFTWDHVKEALTFRSGSTYQPLRDLSYMVDFGLWGDRAVLGMHVQSIILYILMIFTCYAFLRRLLRVFHDDEDECAIWAALASVLYAVHPVHVESVAWLFARKEPLLGIFTFLSLWAFLKARLGSWRYYLLSALAMVLAILSKPTALVIPGVMFVLDIALQARLREPSFWKKRLVLYVPILIVVIPMIVRLVVMMQTAGGVKPYHGGSFWTNLLAVSQILISYIRLIGFNINYAADYPIPLFTDPGTWRPWLYVGLNVLIVGSAAAAFAMKRYVYSFFVAWYYAFLLPVSHIFPISQVLTDRYALLPSLSWCVLLGYLLSRLWHVKVRLGPLSPNFFTALAAGLFGFIGLFYAYMTFNQNDVWQNSQTLWEDTLAKYPNSSPGNVNLSAIYLSQGRPADAQRLAIEAIKALPYDYLAISNLALTQIMMKQYDNAISNYQQALRLKPGLDEARMGLAYAYWEKGDYARAYETYRDLHQENRTGRPAHRDIMYYRLGYAAWKLGLDEEARRYLAVAEPGLRRDVFKLSDLAGVYTSMRDMRKAYELYSDLYDRLEEGEAKDKLARLLGALRKRLDGDAGEVTSP